MNKTLRLLVLVIVFFRFVSPARAMIINITYDPSVTNLGFSTLAPPAVNAAVQWFQNQYTNAITLNITLGFSPGVGLGRSAFNLLGFNYATLTNALRSRRVSAADFSSVASLPANDPTGAGTFWYVPRAECKALGLSGVGANDATTDGTVTFSSMKSYTFDPANRAVAGKFDFIGVVQHEISEVMGRSFGLNYGIPGYSPYDLFRFTNSAARSFGTNDANVYFSVDNGATVQKLFFGNVNTGDLQDWATSTPQDSYDAIVTSGKQSAISSADIISLDVLGYNMPTVTAPVITGTRLGNGSFQIGFNTIANGSFTVVATTNLTVPLGSWTVLGAPTEFSTGAYQYTDSQATANQQRFYRVRSP